MFRSQEKNVKRQNVARTTGEDQGNHITKVQTLVCKSHKKGAAMEDNYIKKDPKAEEARFKHSALALFINGQMTENDLAELKQILLNNVFGAGTLEKMDFLKIFNALEERMKVAVGDYSYLRECLKVTGRLKLCDDILQEENKIRKVMGIEPAQVEPAVQVKTDADSIKKVSKHEDCPDALKYPLQFGNDGKTSGHLLIFDEFTDKRIGSAIDVKRVATLFGNEFGFQIAYHKDKSKEEIIEIYKEMAKEMRNGSVQRFFSMILSIEADEEAILACSPRGAHYYSKETLSLREDILPLFSSCNLPEMAGRPKVFFLVGCRGSAHQKSLQVAKNVEPNAYVPDGSGVLPYAPGTGLSKPFTASKSTNQAGTDDSSQESIPDEADVLVAHSTTKGHVSYRNIVQGTRYIQAICNTFEMYHEVYDILTMMTIVNKEVGRMTTQSSLGDLCTQMPCMYSTLRNRIYMTP